MSPVANARTDFCKSMSTVAGSETIKRKKRTRMNRQI